MWRRGEMGWWRRKMLTPSSRLAGAVRDPVRSWTRNSVQSLNFSLMAAGTETEESLTRAHGEGARHTEISWDWRMQQIHAALRGHMQETCRSLDSFSLREEHFGEAISALQEVQQKLHLSWTCSELSAVHPPHSRSIGITGGSRWGETETKRLWSEGRKLLRGEKKPRLLQLRFRDRKRKRLDHKPNLSEKRTSNSCTDRTLFQLSIDHHFQNKIYISHIWLNFPATKLTWEV